MSHKPGIRAGYDFPSLGLLYGGLKALDEHERVFLAKLLVKELRKGTWAPPEGASDDDIRKAFAEYVQLHFAEASDLKTVIDFQPRLLYSARRLAKRNHPIEAVILYATWMEHWLNAVLLTTALKQGRAEDEAVQMIRDANIRAKVGWLWATLQLPALRDIDRERMTFLADVRNEHVHYKWKGQDPDALYGDNTRLVVAIRDIEDSVEALVALEIDSVLAGDVAVADRLFDVQLKPILRRVALDWQPPEEWDDG